MTWFLMWALGNTREMTRKEKKTQIRLKKSSPNYNSIPNSKPQFKKKKKRYQPKESTIRKITYSIVYEIKQAKSKTHKTST